MGYDFDLLYLYIWHRPWTVSANGFTVLQKCAKIAMEVINYAKLIKYAYSPINFSVSEIHFKFRFQRYMTGLHTEK